MKKRLEVHYYIKHGKRHEFYNSIIENGIAADSCSEEGNEQYDYYFSTENEDELLLLEMWSSEEALAAHSLTKHFERLKAIKDEFVTDTVINRFDIPDKE